MKKVLVISGHTQLSSSVANKIILEGLKKEITNIEIVLLDSLYPDYQIDVEKEQARLREADSIILQYPVFWYSMPSLLERWMELTFLHGFSHGADGKSLTGKNLIVSITTGVPAESYTKDNYGFEVEEMLLPIKATCNLCNIKFAGYVSTNGVSYRKHTDAEEVKVIEAKARQHVTRVMELLNSLDR